MTLNYAKCLKLCLWVDHRSQANCSRAVGQAWCICEQWPLWAVGVCPRNTKSPIPVASCWYFFLRNDASHSSREHFLFVLVYLRLSPPFRCSSQVNRWQFQFFQDVCLFVWCLFLHSLEEASAYEILLEVFYSVALSFSRSSLVFLYSKCISKRAIACNFAWVHNITYIRLAHTIVYVRIA